MSVFCFHKKHETVKFGILLEKFVLERIIIVRPSRFSQYNSDEVVRQYRQRTWIGKGIVIAILIALIVLISTHVLPTFGGIIPVYIVILVAACGIYASYEVSLKKEIRKILFHDCDPQKYLEVMQAFIKDGVTNDKNSSLHLESAKAYAYLRDYTKMKNELDQVFFKKWKWKRELERVHLNGWYAIDRYEHNEIQSAEHELKRIADNIQLNESGTRMVTQISTSWKIKRMAQKHDPAIRPLLSDLVRSYQISPINKINYSLMLAELDVDAKELQNAEERFTYVIEHGNTSADVWYARKELSQSIPQAKILHPQKKSLKVKKSQKSNSKSSSISKAKKSSSPNKVVTTTPQAKKAKGEKSSKLKESSVSSGSIVPPSSRPLAKDLDKKETPSFQSNPSNKSHESPSTTIVMSTKNDLSAESVKALAQEKNRQDKQNNKIKQGLQKHDDFAFQLGTEAQTDETKE